MGKVGGVEETNIFWKAEQCLYFSLHIHFFPLGLCISKKLPFLSFLQFVSSLWNIWRSFTIQGWKKIIHHNLDPFSILPKAKPEKTPKEGRQEKEDERKEEKRKSPKYTAVAIFLLKTLLWIHHLRIVF